MIRDINISAVLNGWVVKVGCQTLVFDEITKLVLSLSDYLRNPEETEKRFLTNSVNAKHTNGGAVPTSYGEQCGEPARSLGEVIRTASHIVPYNGNPITTSR